jgi:hypothetical protein
MTAEELDTAMELYLDCYAEVPLLCETGEALKMLEQLGLAEKHECRYLAVSLPQALDLLRAGSAHQSPVAPLH